MFKGGTFAVVCAAVRGMFVSVLSRQHFHPLKTGAERRQQKRWRLDVGVPPEAFGLWNRYRTRYRETVEDAYG